MAQFLSIFLSAMLAFVTSGCSDQAGTEVQGPKTLKGEIVDTADLFRNTSAYEGRTVVFYVTQVRGNSETELMGESVSVISHDRKASSPFTSMMPSNAALPRWIALGLDPQRMYTVTFQGRPVDVSEGKKLLYTIQIEDFIVNSDDGEADERFLTQPQPVKEALPGAQLTLPIPVTVKDPDQLALHPEAYKKRPVRTKLTLVQSRFAPFDDEFLLVLDDRLKVIVRKDVLKPLMSSMPGVVDVELIGYLVPSRDKDSSTVLRADSLRILAP
ncbi:hypothetical protein F3K02_12500 [Hydrogenophaga sp. D2P1]|uniref:Uncharacterized protein n=1 Tax=Hydrogenophaga aromaticivorans TaxID=2610898 RepID=A0A7Y8KWZ9_9BURK|nr:hypothetical protein [Hydrogenophaga aromaticivorans]NWF46065.1 hypothetical protein [Hydrogenophaga aromaticivorans]